jgi:hypothetical protein
MDCVKEDCHYSQDDVVIKKEEKRFSFFAKACAKVDIHLVQDEIAEKMTEMDFIFCGGLCERGSTLCTR